MKDRGRDEEGSPADSDERASVRIHAPVLLQESLAYLSPKDGDVIVDGTVGAAGHAQEIARAVSPGGALIGLDRDTEILGHAQRTLDSVRERDDLGTRINLYHLCHEDIGAALDRAGVSACDGVLLDLGVSSLQLDSSERGFGFANDGLLDMRMDRTSDTPTAAEWLNRIAEPDLVRVLREYGEERFAGRIARVIKESLPIESTAQLADVIWRAVPPPPAGRRRRIHPATRSFQAIRIAVNDELGHVERGLAAAKSRLKVGGRLVVISFHSLEDRIVKRFIRREMAVVTKKPVSATAAEIARNPRSRSARLRCGVVEAEEQGRGAR